MSNNSLRGAIIAKNLNKTPVQGYISGLRYYVSTTEEVIRFLEGLRRDVQEGNYGPRVMKTLGTSFGVVAGVAGVGAVLAPFTGGLSLLFTGLCAGFGTFGAALVGGNAIIDADRNRAIKNSLDAVQEKHRRSVENLTAKSSTFNYIVTDLIALGHTRQFSVISTFVVFSGKNSWEFYNIYKGSRVVQTAIESQLVTNVLLNKGLQVVRHTTRAGKLTCDIFYPTMTAFRQLSHSAQSTLAVVKNSKLYGAIIRFAPHVFAGIGLALSIWDVTQLHNVWTTPHQSEKLIDDFIKRLKEDCSKVKEQIDVAELFSQ